MSFATHRLLFRLGLLVLSSGLTLLLIEVGLRTYYQHKARRVSASAGTLSDPNYWPQIVGTDGAWIAGHGTVKMVFHPYLLFKHVPNQHNALFNVNSLGFRGEEVNPEKEAGVLRVIVLGGSVSFGFGSSGDSSTLSHQLQRRLNEGRGSGRIEVINAGVIGYVSAQEAAYLETELIDLSPDVVIAFDGFNDFAFSFPVEGCRRPLNHPDHVGHPLLFFELQRLLTDHAAELQAGLGTRLAAAFGPLTREMALSRFLREKLQRRVVRLSRSQGSESRGRASDDPDPYCVRHVVGHYRRNLARMARTLNSHNVRFVIAVQPEWGWTEPASPEDEERRRVTAEEWPWYVGAAQTIYPQFLEAAAKVAAQYGVSAIDLRGSLAGRRERIFLDFAHLNDRGNEVLAEVLADHLRASRLLEQDTSKP